MDKTIEEVLDLFGGSKTRMAEQLGVTRATIHNWCKCEEPPPILMPLVRDWFLRTHGFVPPKWMPAEALPKSAA